AAALQDVVANRRPVITDGFFTSESQRLVVAVLVPVERSGIVRYVFGAHYDPATLMSLISTHQIPHLWAVGIIDRKHITIARSRGREFAGKPASALVLRVAPASGEAYIQLPTLEGVPAHGGIVRSALTGWLIGVSRSGHPIEASIRR